MTKSSVAIIGKSRLADELLALAQAKSLEATPLSDATAVGSTTNFVIDSETGAEDKKRALLQRLDASLPASSVIMTSCLRFSTTQMASWLKKPERVVGFATFYPLKDRRVIELAAGMRTAEPALEQVEQLFKSLGKETVRVKDTPGLTFPRILSLIINEAARSLEEGVARPKRSTWPCGSASIIRRARSGGRIRSAWTKSWRCSKDCSVKPATIVTVRRR